MNKNKKKKKQKKTKTDDKCRLKFGTERVKEELVGDKSGIFIPML